MSGAKSQFCTFYLGNLLFGIEADRVQEVFGARPITPVPRAPAAVSGLVNLRGQILTVIDMNERLGVAARRVNGAYMNIVLRAEPVSLMVDGVDDVLDVDEDAFEPPPQTLSGLAKELIRGVYKLEKQLLHVLNLESTVNLERLSA